VLFIIFMPKGILGALDAAWKKGSGTFFRRTDVSFKEKGS